MKWIAAIVIAGLVITMGCAPKMKPMNVITNQADDSYDTGARTGKKKRKKGKVVWVQQPEAESILSAAAKKSAKDYLMNFEAISIPDFIDTMMTGVFKRNYLITDAARNMNARITIKMTEDLKEERAFALFTQILGMYNVTVSQKQNTYIFDMSKKGSSTTWRGPLVYGRRMPDSPAMSDAREVTAIIPFYNIEPGALKAVLESQLPDKTVILPIDTLNVMVINGNSEDIGYTMSFIDLLDRAQFKDKSIIMISPEYWEVQEFQDKVQELLAAEGLRFDMLDKSRGLWFIPIEKLNSLIVISPVKDWLERVVYWLEKLDVPEAGGESKKVFAYKLKNVEVESAYDILQSYATGNVPDMTRERRSREFSSTSTLGGRTGSTTGAKGGRSTTGRTTNPRSTAKPPTTRGRTSTSRYGTGYRPGMGMGMGMEDMPVSIIPVAETNSVIIVAPPVEYKKYLDILRRIDIPRQQVFVEVIIGNVTLDKGTQLGMEFWMNRYLYKTRFGTKGGLGVYQGQDEQGNQVIPTGSNFFLDGILNGTQFEILMNALVENSKINFVSTPKVTVVENEEAEISVGSDVPVISSETALVGGTVGGSGYTPFRSVQYINTGIILRVRASILSDNKICLDIEQEISEALENKTSAISSPEILKRHIKTTFIVNEGEIAFIGGLFQKKATTSSSGIPVLSKIPLLGNLFKKSSKRMQKTELVVFINAKTIRRSSDMKDIVEGVKKLFSDRLSIDMEPRKPTRRYRETRQKVGSSSPYAVRTDETSSPEAGEVDEELLPEPAAEEQEETPAEVSVVQEEEAQEKQKVQEHKEHKEQKKKDQKKKENNNIKTGKKESAKTAGSSGS